MAPVPPTPIVTERLVLRPWIVEDADGLTAAITASVDHLRPWMPWAGAEPLGRTERVEIIQRFRAGWEAAEDFVIGIFLDGTPIGGTGLHPRVGPGGFEIGYWIHVDHLGRGYATEAVRAVVDAAFALDGIDRVEIHHDVANVASGRIPARLGFTRTEDRQRAPTAPNESGTECIWVLERG